MLMYAVTEWMSENRPEVETEVHKGGQSHYPFFWSGVTEPISLRELDAIGVDRLQGGRRTETNFSGRSTDTLGV